MLITLSAALLIATAAEGKPRQALAVKVEVVGDKATVTVAFNYTGKPGDAPTFQGVRMCRHEVPVGKGPTRVGWQGKEGRQTVVLAGKRFTYVPAMVDRQENGTFALAPVGEGKLRLTGVYHYGGALFVVDETVQAGGPLLLEAPAEGK